VREVWPVGLPRPRTPAAMEDERYLAGCRRLRALMLPEDGTLHGAPAGLA
jgi:hypothetical protein